MSSQVSLNAAMMRNSLERKRIQHSRATVYETIVLLSARVIAGLGARANCAVGRRGPVQAPTRGRVMVTFPTRIFSRFLGCSLFGMRWSGSPVPGSYLRVFDFSSRFVAACETSRCCRLTTGMCLTRTAAVAMMCVTDRARRKHIGLGEKSPRSLCYLKGLKPLGSIGGMV